MTDAPPRDGVHAMVPENRMAPGAKKFRDAYAGVPGAPLYHREFWLMSVTIDRWKQQGMPEDVPMDELFGFDPPGKHSLGQLGWTTAAFAPAFETVVLEDRGDYELVQDGAGRAVLFFKGRREGFMPEYERHPVTDHASWEEKCKWRLDPETPARWADLDARMDAARAVAAEGLMICQNLIGGYMYLRSLLGPEGVLYAVYDMPDLVHDCMRTWFDLADAVTARHQEHVTFDELFLAEDICYNHGSLISPDMMREFLIPYYQQLVTNVKARQIDRDRHLHVQVDTDGYAPPVIDIYRETVGMDAMSPFEVASGCDVVETGRAYPDLFISGGIDKRALAVSKEAVDKHVERILPVMRERGGFIPTIDHGTPPEAPYENYLHYRKRCLELGG